MTYEKLSNSVTESVPILSVHSDYKVQFVLVQIQFNLFTLPNALDCLLFKTRNDMASNGKKNVIVRNTCVNFSINFQHRIYEMFVQTGNVDRHQTAQTVQSDVGCTQYDNCWDIFFS